MARGDRWQTPRVGPRPRRRERGPFSPCRVSLDEKAPPSRRGVGATAAASRVARDVRRRANRPAQPASQEYPPSSARSRGRRGHNQRNEPTHNPPLSVRLRDPRSHAPRKDGKKRPSPFAPKGDLACRVSKRRRGGSAAAAEGARPWPCGGPRTRAARPGWNE